MASAGNDHFSRRLHFAQKRNGLPTGAIQYAIIYYIFWCVVQQTILDYYNN